MKLIKKFDEFQNITESNPWQQDDMATNIENELYEYAGKFRIYPVPNIIGRDAGDNIEQEVVDRQL